MGTLAAVNGEAWASTYVGKETWITLANFTGLAILVAVMEQGSLLNRICSQRWICYIGGLSYSLYVFHLIYRHFFLINVTNYLARHMRISLACVIAAALAFCTTFALSLVSAKFIELPLMSLKRHIRYGTAKDAQAEQVRHSEPALVERGA